MRKNTVKQALAEGKLQLGTGFGQLRSPEIAKILAAAGFRCNVQESGVSCQSETSGKGFTFSAKGYTPQYTDVPANAP